MNSFARLRLSESAATRLLEKRLGLGRKPDNLEPVVSVEVFDAKFQRFLRLLHLRAGHRAGGVDDEDDVLGRGLRFFANVGAARSRK